MSELVIPEGEITGHLSRGCEERILANAPAGHVGGKRIIIEAVTIRYRLEDEPRRPTVHDSERTQLDVVRELAEAAGRTGGCPGIVAPVDETKPDHSLSGHDAEEMPPWMV